MSATEFIITPPDEIKFKGSPDTKVQLVVSSPEPQNFRITAGGARGSNGIDGKTIESASFSGNDIIFVNNDSSEIVLTDAKIELKGEQGIQGTQGLTGSQGIQGETGLIGQKGDKGDAGSQGIQGPQGEQGIQGPQGLTGQEGPKGDTGERGLQGEPGEQGLKGDKGDDGYTPIKGIDYFDGAKGETGEQGLKGDTGERGLQGEQGLQGVKGDTGSKGDQGLQGIQGIQGEQGLQGVPGNPATDTNTRFFTFVLHRGENATTGVNKTNKLIADKAYTITKAYAYATTAPTGASLLFDINVNGTTIWATQANRLAIASTANSGTQTSFNTTALAENDVLSIDIDQIGSTIAGSDITVTLKCEKV